MQSKLQYISKWKEDPKEVLEVMAQEAEGWALVEMEHQNRVKAEGKTKSGRSSKRKLQKNMKKKDGECPKTPSPVLGVATKAIPAGSAGKTRRWATKEVATILEHRDVTLRIVFSDMQKKLGQFVSRIAHLGTDRT